MHRSVKRLAISKTYRFLKPISFSWVDFRFSLDTLQTVCDERRIPIEQFADRLRRKLAPAEDMMYSALLSAFHPYCVTVSAQCIIGPYIADFCIFPAKLIVEIDDSIHNTKKARIHDASRTTYLQHRGYRIIRFTNSKVFLDSKPLVQQVLKLCQPLQLKTPGEVKITHCPPMKARGHWDKRIM